jgi:hypothetical protein
MARFDIRHIGSRQCAASRRRCAPLQNVGTAFLSHIVTRAAAAEGCAAWAVLQRGRMQVRLFRVSTVTQAYSSRTGN